MAKRRAPQDASSMALEVIVHVPVSEPIGNGYQSERFLFDQLHISNLTKRQKLAMRSLYAGLRRDNVEIGPLKPVASQADGIRWLLDSIADACEVA